MELAAAFQIIAFTLFAVIAVAGALGMATSMSMFRSGIFLMASFMGVGGLFILLMADLLGMLQIMMYIGGMLVMILFMVLFSQDPGGSMMAGMMKQGTMKMSWLEMLFSRGLVQGQHGNNEEHGSASHMQRHTDDTQQAGSNGHRDQEQQHEPKQQGMDMDDMSMFTPIKRQAAILALLIGALLTAFILFRPAWPVISQIPDQNSPGQIGTLLMGKYMIAFEGSGLLILLGIFASVMISRPSKHPDPSDRELLKAAVAQNPAPIEPDALQQVQPRHSREEQEP
jgi:NADH-quinone oxidoreductase subunit J